MNRPDHTKRTACRACGGSDFENFLQLGPTPLANSVLRSADEFANEKSYPLDVYFCRRCSLVQLLDVIDPEVLFRDYIYVTGTSDTMAAHNDAYAAAVTSLLDLTATDLVVEVASNDGSLLSCFSRRAIGVLGVEPALNIAAKAEARGIRTVPEFFNTATAASVRETYGPAAAVIGNNVLAHVDDPQDFLRGARSLLKPGGLVIIEAPYVRDMVERLEYDTIYHEHLCYFSVTSLMRLCETVGLSLVKIEYFPVHGGSLRMYAARAEDVPDHGAAVRELAREEVTLGLTSVERYQRFASGVACNRNAVQAFFENVTGAGKTVAAYGAPAKGNTLLNYCGIGTESLPFTVDKNPMKVGLYTPGMHIPVLPVSTLLERQPDYLFLLAWNFAAEIMTQQSDYASRGGHFVTPVPEPRVMRAAVAR